jgi:hypothetical protein
MHRRAIDDSRPLNNGSRAPRRRRNNARTNEQNEGSKPLGHAASVPQARE